MKKISRIFILVIMISFVIFANNFVKADDDAFGEVTSLSDGEVTIEGSGTANVTLKYNSLKLTWHKADPSIGRNLDGYWVGYRIDFPKKLGGNEAQETEVKKAKYRGKFADRDWSETKSFFDAKDGKWFMTGWVYLTQERLDANEGEFELYEVEFDWKGDGNFEQKIKIMINPENVVLDKSNVTTVTIKESGNGASDEVRTFTIEKGKSLKEGLIESELKTLESIRNEEGFVKFYQEGKQDEEFLFEEAINESDITIIALFNKPVVEPEPEPTPEPEPEPTDNQIKDETPKTGIIEMNKVVVIMAFALVVTPIGIVILRKKQ